MLSAFDGRDAVIATLEGGGTDTPARLHGINAASAPRAGAYLTAIEVEGFRGVGPAVSLDIRPGPGLTLVVGRNGSGKSSFAEALEFLLTGASRRWSARAKVWQDNWRNLHHDAARVAARFTLDGRPGQVEIARTWEDGADLGSSVLSIDGRGATGLDDLGWAGGLASHPPLLSHNELGRILEDGPTKLHDALAAILGLEDITTAQATLAAVRREAEVAVKGAEARGDSLRQTLLGIDDERARAVAVAITGTAWDVAAVDAVVRGGAADVDEHVVVTALRGLATLPVVDRDAAAAVAEELHTAHADVAKVATTNAGRARENAVLLEQALAFHLAHAGTTCPVCGTGDVLTFEWRRRTTDMAAALRGEAVAADAMHAAAVRARKRAEALLTAPPATLGRDADPAGFDLADVRALWTAWSAIPDGDLAVLAHHITTTAAPLTAAVADLRRRALTELERREDAWRPAAQDVAAWLPAARDAVHQRVVIATVRAAERWLKDAHDAIRNERFDPVAAKVQSNWTALRQDSNVELGALKLAGSASQRRLTLDVNVDGADGSALGVMSQGELNCLAISLFLPRAAMPESPFRFLVIDDPVQAMDPAKVEGLARVLDDVAGDRQVVVFTHDNRLPETVARLGIAVDVIEVTRREGSLVDLRPVRDPVTRYFEDVFALTKSKLPAAAARAIPGICRLALETACQRAVTARWLARGRSHADVDELLGAPKKLNAWMALWAYDDAARSGDVMTYLRNAGMERGADAVAWCNRGAHEAVAGDVTSMARACEELADSIMERRGARV